MAAKTKAYGYVRVSGTSQLEGYGPQRQREDIERFADRGRGYDIVGWYEDAYTGTEEDRPQFVEMLRVIKENGVRCVIVESLDRLSRDLMIQSALLAKLAAEGISLVAANVGVDVTEAMAEDPMRRALVQIMGVFAELDKNITVRKLARGREAAKAKHGRCGGRYEFGHYPEEKPALDRLRQLRRKPVKGDRPSYRATAQALNNEGYTTRSGGQWYPATVQKICRYRGWK